MIRARIHESAGRIESFRVSGHAGHGSAGEDVVCAAVSALVLNAINSCERLLGVELDVDDDGEEIRCRVPLRKTAPHTDEVNLLLQSMAFGLEQTAQEYPTYIRLTRTDTTNEFGE